MKRIMKRFGILCLVTMVTVLLWHEESQAAQAAVWNSKKGFQSQSEVWSVKEEYGSILTDGLGDMMDRVGLDEIEEFLSKRENGTGLSLGTTMQKLIHGDFIGVAEDIGKTLYAALFAEISTGGRLIGQILLLGILGAVFHNFSSVFQSSQISETGFFVTYLLLFTFLTAAFAASASVAAETVKTILDFMKVLMPAYFLTVAFAGGSATAVAMYEMTMFGMTASEWLLHTIMIPLVRVYLILVMAGNMMKGNIFSKLTELVEQTMNWGMKTLLGIVLGFHLLQTLVLPYVDSLKNGTVQKVIGMIPGIGQGAAAMTQMFLGAGVLIKNSMGAAAVVILMILAAVPVAKLFVLMLLYQCVAAVMEPVCDKRIMACVSAAAKGHKMLLRIVTTAVLLFIITIAIVCVGTNVMYYA